MTYTVEQLRDELSDRWTDLEALAKAATPGPWEAVEGATSDGWWVERPHISTIVSDPTGPDAQFIAAANPQTILDLIAAARTAENRLAALEAMRAKVLALHEPIRWYTIQCDYPECEREHAEVCYHDLYHADEWRPVCNICSGPDVEVRDEPVDWPCLTARVLEVIE